MSDCLFCRIVSGEIPGTEVYADDEVLAFRDIDPQAPTHVLVIPRRHISALTELGPDDIALAGKLMHTATEIARDDGLAAGGYRLVVNCGDDGGQTVGHLHLHLLGGRPMKWPPG